jgi:phage shock protein PspC (stress-responsive transcriptional regulator)
MNDKPKNTPKTKKSTNVSGPGPRGPLLRSHDDRMLAGVAGGLAEHLNIDSTLVRVGFVITTLFGGVGILAYLILAVALPQDDGTGKPVDEPVGARLGRVLLITLLVAAALAGAATLFAVSAWTVATGHGTVIAAVVIALGALVAAVAFAGDVRGKVAPWLIGAALVLGVPAGAIAAADIEIDESLGERSYNPTAVPDLPADGYELGTGQLVVDLRDLPWRNGETIAVQADLGIGQMIVSVPSQVCVQAQATAKAGELLIAGDASDGWDADVDQGSPTTNAPVLKLDAGLQFGQMIVTDEDPSAAEHRNRSDYDHNQEMEDAQERVCGR